MTKQCQNTTQAKVLQGESCLFLLLLKTERILLPVAVLGISKRDWGCSASLSNCWCNCGALQLNRVPELSERIHTDANVVSAGHCLFPGQSPSGCIELPKLVSICVVLCLILLSESPTPGMGSVMIHWILVLHGVFYNLSFQCLPRFSWFYWSHCFPESVCHFRCSSLVSQNLKYFQ